jgi:hypothetical protein
VQPVSAGRRATPHAFDPVGVARHEADAWVAYYRREWVRLLAALLRLVAAVFGMGPRRTAAGAWHLLRGFQRWSPLPDNDPDGARRSMERFYALVARTAGVPLDPARAAWLEVEWWRVHRERQHGGPDDGQELERALAHLYAYAYDVPADAMLEAARWRVRAMDLSDRWVSAGRCRDDPQLGRVFRALVRSHTSLLDAVPRRARVGPQPPVCRG